MRQRTLLIALAVLIPAAFLAGRFAQHGDDAPGAGGRKVLYYVDPMNPSFHSPEPGTAPCGMPLEPVYANDSGAPAGGTAPQNAVSVSPDRLQLVGVAREKVQTRNLRHALRLVGTVAADETRLFRISAATGGRVREMGTVTTGGLVAKGEVLGAYYATELLVPQQNYLRMYETYQKVQMTGRNPMDNLQGGGQLATYWRNVDVARQSLMNLGMSAQQIEEVTASRQPAYLVQMRAPAAGIVTARNVVLGQSFEAGEELFSIADLSRVWVLADVFEGQEEFLTPGLPATVTLPGAGRRFPAAVSRALPRFDAATRTLKVRLEVDNPGFVLRPDMFLDVELPVGVGGIFVPKEAVLDSGTRKVVFVEQGEGVFVPRTVRAGRRIGDQVEIRGGLMEGETIVTAGNFLLDSESRMRAAGAEAAGAALDPICGMEVEETKARSQGLVSAHGGSTWFFCSAGCKQAFERDPKAAVAKIKRTEEPMAEKPQTAISPGSKAFHAQDPVCGMDVDPDEAARVGLTSSFQGASFSFCSPACKEIFDRDPSGVLARQEDGRSIPFAAPGGAMHDGGHGGMVPAMPQEAPPPEPEAGHGGMAPMPGSMSPPAAQPQDMPQELPQELPPPAPGAGHEGHMPAGR